MYIRKPFQSIVEVSYMHPSNRAFAVTCSILLLVLTLVMAFGYLASSRQVALNVVVGIPSNDLMFSDEYFVPLGASVSVAERTLTLMDVDSSGSVQVSVNGDIVTIPYGRSVTVNGLEVTTVHYYYDEDPAAVLRLLRSDNYLMNVGDSTSVGGTPVTLVNVGSTGNVQLRVGDLVQTVPYQQTRVIGGVSIMPISFHWAEELYNRTATLHMVTFSGGGGSPLRIKTTA